MTLGGRERSGQRTMWVKVPIARGDPGVRLDGALLTLARVQTVAQQTPPPSCLGTHRVAHHSMDPITYKVEVGLSPQPSPPPTLTPFQKPNAKIKFHFLTSGSTVQES